METRFAPPLVTDGSGQGQLLKRIPLDAPPFDETGLQEILRNHPELLCCAQFDPLFSDSVCIGREVIFSCGRADNLYVSPHGGITVVETKLWKNTGSRREAVVQILEYAKELSRRSYDALQDIASAHVRKYHPESSLSSLYAWVSERAAVQPPDEQSFIERVSRNLSAGRFLLLIVGEGIRDSAQDLVEHIGRTPALGYNLSLIELACYALPGRQTSVLIVPRIVARTVEIERAVVRIELVGDAKQNVRTHASTPGAASESGRPGGERLVSPSDLEFAERLSANLGPAGAQQVSDFLDELRALGADVEPGKRQMVVTYQPSHDGAHELSVLLVYDDGTIGHGTWMRE